MLQAIRANEEKAHFYVAYIEFELAFLTKIMQRRNILTNGGEEKKDKLDFIDEIENNPEDEVMEETKPGTELNLVSIVL